MKISALLIAAGLALASMVGVSIAMPQAQVPPPSPGNALPPPGMDDPGVAPADTAVSPMSPPAVSLPSMHDAGPGDTGAQPEVTVHQHGDDNVQEYWRAGQVYMVVVTPKNGIPQTYMLDQQGGWVDAHGQKPLRPVMYKILEWGKSKPAPARSSSGQ